MDPLLKGEQAVLGAVLLAPGQLDSLRWLEPTDFYRPAHQALFAAMRKLRADGLLTPGTQNDVPLSWVTDTVAEAGRHARGLTASYAHALIAACPRPQNAPVYGRMVLEGSIHRTVAEYAARLEEVARIDARAREIDGVLKHSEVLADALTGLARRWGTESRPVAPTEPVQPQPATVPVVADDRLEDEQFLLALLVERPVAIEEVVGWLRPADFGDPGHGHLYRCLGALHHRGEPIDRVTVLWEIQRRGLLADGLLREDQLGAILGVGGAGSAEWLGDQVIRASLTRTAAEAARTIRALASDARLAPGQLIGHALHALGPLEEVRTRWRTSASPPSPHPADPAIRISAALARSAPRQHPRSTAPERPTPPSTAPIRTPARTSPSLSARSTP
ncbi:DnaB-like helicase N-terminal domain-containing protein [Kitasatospora sp. NPDC051914]|uniref:DnaB-like helicase N-terminal domain-containing protein n=1 Tax=Kitasatospora sp. NPDC051914 TaxID=3154945 RepID=UPI0034478B0B